eukprot:6174974-Pleurochrysis_carterae.AAC.2
MFSDSCVISDDISETREVRGGVATPKGRQNTKRPVQGHVWWWHAGVQSQEEHESVAVSRQS